MAPSRRRRASWSRLARATSAVLALLIASMTLGFGAATSPAAASPVDASQAQAIPRGVDVGIRAKSDYEQVYNPFGDDWATKAGPNPAIAVGLTPACYRHGPKSALRNGPPQEETAFIAKSNTPMVWEECADVMDASGPDIAGNVGDPRIKANIAAQKAANPALKYVGYLALVRADTHIADGSAAPVGLNYIHRNREDWFVHTKGAPPTPQNRVRYIQEPSHLYDVTNPEFRAFMVARIVESLNYHGMDGFVLDQCFDQPTVIGGLAVVPDQIVANWGQSCLAMLSELKTALDRIGKRVFFTGFFHIGSNGDDLQEEAFYRARIDVSHGIFWEDPFREVGASDQTALNSTDRLLRLQDYALQNGRHFVNVVNTAFQGQSAFATTSYEQQQYLARYFLAGFLQSASTASIPEWGPLRVMYHYTPISVGPQFYSAAFYREWDAPIGTPTSAPQKVVDGGVPIYQREFQNARVVFNASSGPYTANLSDGQWTTTSGDVLPATALVPAKSGAIFLRAGAAPGPGPGPGPQPTDCTPRPKVNVRVTNLGEGRIQAVISTSPGGGSIQRIQVLETRNAVVNVQGGPNNATGAFSHTPAFGATSVVLEVRRAATGAMTVPLVVTDGCGE